MQMVNGKFEINCWQFDCTNPCGLLGGIHAILWPGTQSPPFNLITQQGANRLGLSWGFWKIFLLEVAQKFSGDPPPPIPKPPQMTTHQPTPENQLNHYLSTAGFWMCELYFNRHVPKSYENYSLLVAGYIYAMITQLLAGTYKKMRYRSTDLASPLKQDRLSQ